MVYCGKPSKACRKCRDRNIKCDKKVPSCGQCIRGRFSCPGYHDPSVLTFRNETNTVIRRSQRTNPESKPPPLQKITIPNPRMTSSIPYSLLPPLIIRAKSLFVSDQVYSPTSKFSFITSFFPPDLYHNHFLTSMQAVSLAYLALDKRSSEIMERAMKAYGDSLRLLNQALQDRGLARKNETLATVLLLNYFEKLLEKEKNLVGEETEGKEEGTKHLEGAMALVQLRGEEQFQDPVGHQLFKHLSDLVQDQCIKSSIDVPEYFNRMLEMESRSDAVDVVMENRVPFGH